MMTIRDLTIDELKDLIEATVMKAIAKCPMGTAHDKQIKRLQFVGILIAIVLIITHPVEVRQILDLAIR